MIAQLARGGMVFDEPRYVHAASIGIASVQRSLFDAKTNLLSRRPGVPATAADYAAVIDGAIETYQATLEPRWLDFALRLEAVRDDRAFAAVPEPVRDFVSGPIQSGGSAAALLDSITGRAPSDLTRVVIFGRPYRPETLQLLKAAYGHAVIVFGGEAKKPTPANVVIGSLQPNPDGTPSAYICRPAGCSAAFTDPAALSTALR